MDNLSSEEKEFLVLLLHHNKNIWNEKIVKSILNKIDFILGEKKLLARWEHN